MGFLHSEFSNTLIKWYLSNQRSVPWRNTSDPYKIWVSEILLQQTRVAQALPYYNTFLETFPTVFDLAKASEKEVLKCWQGLGYYSRARYMHHSAKYISNELKGIFPNTFIELLKLKGIGDYTASAIASICFNEPQAVVDGNVYRALSRIFGIATPINSKEGLKEFKQLATKLIDHKNPGGHNQALMEFGALQCKPTDPFCGTCPFSGYCTAFQQKKITDFPVKLKKAKITERHFNYLIFLSEDGHTILQQRQGKGIWQNLYEFPLIESKNEETLESFGRNPELQPLLGTSKIELYNQKPVKHLLSHQKLFAKFWIVSCEELPVFKFSQRPDIVALPDLADFPVPVLLEKFIDAFSGVENNSCQ